ncbi:TetR family transcriptional regulator [Caulobacter mirabilis]|uniref:TetR family transcriptional regulator n=2 Tax=Caulobacter mirabilis TaxID=69666 RepID=A0A2D2AYS3_9CAUL|nr:TetR family transcriptional regulator [Caulobacter mirabilis]
MPREERRRQLLETAATVIRTEGTDALTLARLAEQAGVTKPIAYEHFGTRAGLLIALYRHFDEQQSEAVHAALAETARTLDDAVAIVAAAYVDCVLQAGPEYGAIAAALSASEEMSDVRQTLREGYVDLYQAALARFVLDPAAVSRPLLLGLIAAADGLSEAAAAERMSRDEAVDALSRIMLGALRD